MTCSSMHLSVTDRCESGTTFAQMGALATPSRGMGGIKVRLEFGTVVGGAHFSPICLHSAPVLRKPMMLRQVGGSVEEPGAGIRRNHLSLI